MRIGFKIVSNNRTSQARQFVGFGVGNTLEVSKLWFDYNGVGFRGRVNNYAGTSDFWVGWSPAAGTIRSTKMVNLRGRRDYDAATNVVLSGNDRLELELYFDSFRPVPR